MIKRWRIIDRELLARHSGTVAGFVLSIRNFMLVSPSGKNGSSRSVKISVAAMLGKGENKGRKAHVLAIFQPAKKPEGAGGRALGLC